MNEDNDLEIFQPSDCLFAVGIDPDNPTQGCIVSITDKKYWNDSSCLNDQFADHSLPEEVVEKMEKNGIYNLMEATWGSEFNMNKTKKIMLDLGFEFSQSLQDFIDETN